MTNTTNTTDLRAALVLAEAALSDIGDADREPSDDLAWCEARAAKDLPAIRAALAAPAQAVPAPGVPSDSASAVREACGKIIKTLAAIVNSPQSDDQLDNEVLQRDPVMAKVMEIKSQVDAIYKAVPLPIHPYMQRQKAAAGVTAAPAQAGEDEFVTREGWVESAMRVYLIAGDTEKEARECAEYLCGEQDMDDLEDPIAAAMEDCEGRGAAQAQHPDDAAVEKLAEAMKQKLAEKRAQGRSGWDTDCTQQRLSALLRQQVDKGHAVNVANFCAFLFSRGESVSAAQAQEDARKPLTEAEVSSVYFEVLGTVRIQDPTLINRLVRAIEAAHGIADQQGATDAS